MWTVCCVWCQTCMDPVALTSCIKSWTISVSVTLCVVVVVAVEEVESGPWLWTAVGQRLKHVHSLSWRITAGDSVRIRLLTTHTHSWGQHERAPGIDPVQQKTTRPASRKHLAVPCFHACAPNGCAFWTYSLISGPGVLAKAAVLTVIRFSVDVTSQSSSSLSSHPSWWSSKWSFSKRAVCVKAFSCEYGVSSLNLCNPEGQHCGIITGSIYQTPHTVFKDVNTPIKVPFKAINPLLLIIWEH